MEFRRYSDVAFRADAPDTLFVQAPEAPTHLYAVPIGGLSQQRARRPLAVKDLTHVRTVRIPTDRHYTSNTTYSVLRYVEGSRSRLVVLTVSGFGPRLFLLDHLSLEATLGPLLETLDEGVLWDLLDAMIDGIDGGYLFGRARERRRWQIAAAEKRIKVRKVRGQDAVQVKIDTIMPAPGPNGERHCVIEIGGEMLGMRPWDRERAASQADSAVPVGDQPYEAGQPV